MHAHTFLHKLTLARVAWYCNHNGKARSHFSGENTLKKKYLISFLCQSEFLFQELFRGSEFESFWFLFHLFSFLLNKHFACWPGALLFRGHIFYYLGLGLAPPPHPPLFPAPPTSRRRRIHPWPSKPTPIEKRSGMTSFLSVYAQKWEFIIDPIKLVTPLLPPPPCIYLPPASGVQERGNIKKNTPSCQSLAIFVRPYTAGGFFFIASGLLCGGEKKSRWT